MLMSSFSVEAMFPRCSAAVAFKWTYFHFEFTAVKFKHLKGIPKGHLGG